MMNKTGEIESVGIGAQEMIKECKSLGKPEPEYIERGNTFVVCFKTQTVPNFEFVEGAKWAEKHRDWSKIRCFCNRSNIA